MAPKKSRAGSIVPYNDGQMWFHHKENAIAIGITIEATDELGEVNSIELPDEGDDFDKDDIIAEVHGENGSLKITAPAAGFIAEINTAISEEPTIVNEDPIDEGWLVKLELQDESDLKEYQ